AQSRGARTPTPARLKTRPANSGVPVRALAPLGSRAAGCGCLGLLVSDEQRRFGVRQKEALKALRAEVDVLTLTATPIPRTLAMSLEGLRDLSVIATAPERRLAIRTFVTPYSPGIIREAALRELKRGGQIFFLHNDVA